MSAWQAAELRDTLDVEAASDDVAAVPLARWLHDHPDGIVTAEDFADCPAELPALRER